MRAVNAAWIAQAVGGALHAPEALEVTSVWNDTRSLAPGALYVAVVGDNFDGHNFVAAAHEAGAVLTLASRPVEGPHILVDDVVRAVGDLARAYLALLRAEGELTVIGITGSNGKTTTKDLLFDLLPDAHAPIKSYNDALGMPLTVLGTAPSTRHLILEMGASAPGDIDYLTSIAPLDIAVVLMVGTAHSAGYGSRDALAAEKSTILRGLVPGGVGIINADDPRVAAMASIPPRLVTFGFGPADVHGENLREERGRAAFDLQGKALHLSLIGEHHAHNALAAAAVGLECSLEAERIAGVLSASKPRSAHRMALTERPDGIVILDDAYNASPESMRAAFKALRAVADGGRMWAVIGEMLEMGDESLAAHEDIGVDAVRLGIDHLVVVGSGARAAYVSAVREGSWGDEAQWVATIDEAYSLVEQEARPGDTILVKGSHGTGLWRLADMLTEVEQ